MLFLLFHLGKDRYALNAAQVIEVLPVVEFKEIPQAGRGVAGAFTYRGVPVPLLDLCGLALGRPSRLLMSTRIFLVNYEDPSGECHLLGLLAEQATGTIQRESDDFVDSGIAVDAAPYLGPVTADALGMIQRVEIDQLLPAETREQLFRLPLEVA